MALPWMTGGVAGVDEEEQKLPFAIPSRKQVFGEEEEAARAVDSHEITPLELGIPL